MASLNLRAAYAKHVLRQQLEEQRPQWFTHGTLSDAVPEGFDAPEEWDKLPLIDTKYDDPICIVGAGAAGLSTAVMLSFIGFTNITIYEASNRVGGRIYTYKFKNGPDCKHNYYDVGAMRIPDIETQKSTLNMIDWLNGQGAKIDLVEYIYNVDDAPSWPNYPNSEIDTKFDTYMKLLLEKRGFIDPAPQLWPMPNKPNPVDDSVHIEAVKKRKEKFDNAFVDFIASGSKPDHYSTRAWLMLSKNEDAPDPNWTFLDTQIAQSGATSTGIFDQAFMESICDYYDFNVAKIENKGWKRLEGGMATLTDALHDQVVKDGVKVILDTPVTTMSDKGDTIAVATKQSPIDAAPQFAAVFNTTTFGCLQRMDLNGLNLSPDNMCGIRSLAYDHATKVAFKFKKPWWQPLIEKGGVSSTNLPISSVVYPSWNDGADSPHTIIVSYSWAQDAVRMAALMGENDKESTDINSTVAQVCLRELAALWTEKSKQRVSYDQLRDLYISHHAFAWPQDIHTAGAYALFGPGQFEFLYGQFTKPLCQNKLMICGEAVSAHHAWISGAFDSAYNAILTWCRAQGYLDAESKLTASPFGQGQGQNTAEYDPQLFKLNLKVAADQDKQRTSEMASR